MEAVDIQEDLHMLPCPRPRSRVDPGKEPVLSAHDVQKALVSHHLGHIDDPIDRLTADLGANECPVVEVLGPNAAGDFFASMGREAPTAIRR